MVPIGMAGMKIILFINLFVVSDVTVFDMRDGLSAAGRTNMTDCTDPFVAHMK